MRTRKAFTLIELTVAIGLLALVISFASVIFRYSIEGYRTATANTEIMQKLRALTDQLNNDFGGLQAEAQLLIRFYKYGESRDDRILLFANGDFQSTQLYSDTSGEPDENGDFLVVGNIARIFYGRNGQLLARRQHILTADPNTEDWPNIDMSDFSQTLNELYEHDRLSLAEWKTVETDEIIPTCFDQPPVLNLEDPNTFHKLMCEAVSSFAVQWAYWDEDDDKFYWFPDDSDFSDISNEFGVYFNVPGPVSIPGWYNPLADAEFTGEDFSLYPKALKFTFTLHDSKGLLEGGRTFTHIVYIGD